MKIRTKQILDVLGLILCLAIGVCIVIAIGTCAANADPDWREHDAAKHLGSGAMCSDHNDQIVPCVYDGHAYQCIVDNTEHVACAQVERLP